MLGLPRRWTAASSKVAATLALSVLVVLAVPGVGMALTQEEYLGRFGSSGTGAGELILPFALATDSDNGEVFIADRNRIDVFGPWGDFRRAFGWGVATGGAALETCSTTCGPGLEGSDAGQMEIPSGVTVDDEHNIYVFERGNARVQKFSPSGAFLLMFGGEVNKTTGGNLCPETSGDVCGAGVEGSGAGFFSYQAPKRNTEITPISWSPNGHILVGGANRIQEFSPGGEFIDEISGGILSGNTVTGIAADQSSGDIYVLLEEKPNVYRIDEEGTLQDELNVEDPWAVAADPQGNVFVIDYGSGRHPRRILQFDSAGEPVTSLEVDAEVDPDERNVLLEGLGTNDLGDLYVIHSGSGFETGPVAYISFLGPPPLAYGPPPRNAPTITTQFASAVGAHEAALEARINPHYWTETSYYVEYGTGSCVAGGCGSVAPAPQGLELGEASNVAQATEPIHLAGLQPGTVYHYRFVSEGPGGGPVYGVDPDGVGPEKANAESGLEGTFTTFASEDSVPACPNDPLRVAAAAALPDCRAYEMVSPPDKEGGDIIAPINITGFENRLNQSSIDGDKLTYSSYRAFAGSKSASYVSQYIASRTPAGWSTEPLAEQRDEGFFNDARKTENEFKAFTPDLCRAWLLRESDPVLAPGAVAGFPNLYRRENCLGGYEALTTVSPPNLAPKEFDPVLQGYAADGSAAIFQVADRLTPDAIAGKFQLYEARAGGLSLVCVMPDGTPYPGDCSAGSPSGTATEFPNRSDTVRNAMSEDGSRIYWSTTKGENGLGQIYLRLNGTDTVEVSGKASSAEARFLQASPDGSRALFMIEDRTAPITVLNHNLYEYDLGSETTSLIGGKVLGVVAASEDLSRVYFVSEEAIGGEGTPGQPNLYMNGDGTNTFIATLSGEDVRSEARNPGSNTPPSDATPAPIFHVAQVSPDGGRLAFISNEPLTGFDNADAVSGEPDSEVFTYAAATRKLDCVSCSPAGARPSGQNVEVPGNSGSLWTAASLPLGENQLYTPRTLSADGKHLFFTSYADLLPRDRNGRADVYEWEQAGASSSCKDEADPDFYVADGGCLFLISTGSSPQDSELVDLSASGRDVFFTTKENLLPQDIDLEDIYDARVDGGFPLPPASPPPCEGEDCQPAVVAPNFPTPASDTARPGNPPKVRCPKKKHRVVRGGRERCTRHRGKHHKGKKKPLKHKNGRHGR